MARPERHDADYFPFYVKDGKTLFILESKYGLQGIGFFTNLMRFLTRQTDHNICIQDESDRLYFFAQIRCSEEIGMNMLNLMAKTEKIDAKLWTENKVIVSQDLLNSLRDAYKNRKNPIIEIDKIRVTYQNNQITYPNNLITSPDNPQRKLKERKLKERKEKKISIPPDFKISDRVKEWAIKKGFSQLNDHLELFKLSCAAKGYEYIDWDAAFMKAIRENWAKIGGSSYVRTNSGQRDIRTQRERELDAETEAINKEYYDSLKSGADS